MAIQLYADDLDYVNAKLKEPLDEHSFLKAFLNACLRADPQNFVILRPALVEIARKYPARPELLEAEKQNNPSL